jgi:hypothetical protein
MVNPRPTSTPRWPQAGSIPTLADAVLDMLTAYDKMSSDPSYTLPWGTLRTAWAAHTTALAVPASAPQGDAFYQELLSAVANHHTSVDNMESLHCNSCGTDLDDGGEHKEGCLVVRAQAALAEVIDLDKRP